MANITRVMADTAGFIPQVWAQRALGVLRANMVLTQLVTREGGTAAQIPAVFSLGR